MSLKQLNAQIELPVSAETAFAYHERPGLYCVSCHLGKRYAFSQAINRCRLVRRFACRCERQAFL